MNKGVNRDWLKLVAGELRGLLWVRIPVRHPDTGVTLFNENLALLAGDREVTVISSDNPDSRVIGVTLALADVRNEVTGSLGPTERFFRRLLRRRFATEIAAYFKIVKDLQTQNLRVLQPRHFRPEVAEQGEFRRQTEYGHLVISREVDSRGAVAFTLVSAPEDHPITAARGEMGVTVMYIDGRPLKKSDQTPAQELLFEALSSFGKVTEPQRLVSTY